MTDVTVVVVAVSVVAVVAVVHHLSAAQLVPVPVVMLLSCHQHVLSVSSLF